MKDQTKIIVGLLAGAAVITAVGYLLTSDKGKEVQEEISDYLADVIKSVKNKVQATSDDLTDLKNDTVKNVRSAIKNKVDQVADSAL